MIEVKFWPGNCVTRAGIIRVDRYGTKDLHRLLWVFNEHSWFCWFCHALAYFSILYCPITDFKFVFVSFFPLLSTYWKGKKIVQFTVVFVFQWTSYRYVCANKCKPRSDCFFRVYIVCQSICIFWTRFSVVKHFSNFRRCTAVFLGVRIVSFFFYDTFSLKSTFS